MARTVRPPRAARHGGPPPEGAPAAGENAHCGKGGGGEGCLSLGAGVWDGTSRRGCWGGGAALPIARGSRGGAGAVVRAPPPCPCMPRVIVRGDGPRSPCARGAAAKTASATVNSFSGRPRAAPRVSRTPRAPAAHFSVPPKQSQQPWLSQVGRVCPRSGPSPPAAGRAGPRGRDGARAARRDVRGARRHRRAPIGVPRDRLPPKTCRPRRRPRPRARRLRAGPAPPRHARVGRAGPPRPRPGGARRARAGGAGRRRGAPQGEEGRPRLLRRPRHLRHPQVAAGRVRLRGGDVHRRPRPGAGAGVGALGRRAAGAGPLQGVRAGRRGAASSAAQRSAAARGMAGAPRARARARRGRRAPQPRERGSPPPTPPPQGRGARARPQEGGADGRQVHLHR
jgi:hypothetical protein